MSIRRYFSSGLICDKCSEVLEQIKSSANLFCKRLITQKNELQSLKSVIESSKINSKVLIERFPNEIFRMGSLIQDYLSKFSNDSTYIALKRSSFN